MTPLGFPGAAVRLGAHGMPVLAVQKRLVDLGYAPLAADGAFGRATLAAVKLFQTQRGLDADGVVGPVTWGTLFSLPSMVLAEPPNQYLAKVIAAARHEIGAREVGGPNCGPRIEQYLARVGLPPGKAWCMAFTYWCFDEGTHLGMKNPLVKTGRVLEHWERARPEVKIPSAATEDDIGIVKPGAIFCVDHGEDRGHCGIVVSVSPMILVTVEGNTSSNGSREGNGVYQRRRRWTEINLGFLDYSRVT